MEAFFIILCVIILITIFYHVLSQASNKKIDEDVERLQDIREAKEEAEQKRKEVEEKRKQENKELYDSLIARLGECTAGVNYGEWRDSPEFDMDKSVLIFDEAKIIVINSIEYNFSDILGFSMEDNTTNKTTIYSEGESKTSTGSMLGRAAVGGLLTGGVGAIVGAATAKKDTSTDSFSTTETEHTYVIHININSFNDPIITLDLGSKSVKAHKLAGLLNVIIERNK